MDVLIRKPAKTEFSQWKSLWDLYLDFYETVLQSGHTEQLWERILDPERSAICHVAERNSHLVGLVHFFPHEDTWNARPICYLQDLYVESSLRGEGIGAKLIGSVVEQADTNGWSAVYWLTAEDNHQARVLYDKLTGEASGLIHYEIETPRIRPRT